jgi:hypothetical protein
MPFPRVIEVPDGMAVLTGFSCTDVVMPSGMAVPATDITMGTFIEHIGINISRRGCRTPAAVHYIKGEMASFAVPGCDIV